MKSSLPPLYTDAHHGLVFALELDRKGGGRELDWKAVEAQWLTPKLTWLHFDCSSDNAQTWLRKQSGVPESHCDYLLAKETRPGVHMANDSALLILRVLNQHPEKAREDMVSLRLWMTADRILSMRLRRVYSVRTLRERLVQGNGPEDSGTFLAQLLEKLVLEFHDYVFSCEERLDRIAHQSDASDGSEQEAALRLELVDVRRFLVPQLSVIQELANARLTWMQEDHHFELRTIAERFKRVIDDLDLILVRLEVYRDERNRRTSEILNGRMYVLSIITAIFLPLGLVTGMLGMNVGGIPAASTQWGFLGVCALLGTAALGGLLLLRRWRWF